MKHTMYRLLVFSVMLILLGSQAVLAAAQDDEPEADIAMDMACLSAEDDLSSLLDALKAEHPGHEHPPHSRVKLAPQ